jgi:signal recognition particle subunit SRP14
MAGDHLTNDEVAAPSFEDSNCAGLIQPPQFFTQLSNLFEHNRQKGHGTIYLTQKRLTHNTFPPPPAETIANDPLWDTYHPEEPVPILIRASNNKSSKRPGKDRPGCDRENTDKTRISTVVQPEQIDAFYVRYAEACRAGMGSLKKRDKKKGKKDKKKKKRAQGAVAETKG